MVQQVVLLDVVSAILASVAVLFDDAVKQVVRSCKRTVQFPVVLCRKLVESWYEHVKRTEQAAHSRLQIFQRAIRFGRAILRVVQGTEGVRKCCQAFLLVSDGNQHVNGRYEIKGAIFAL